MLQLKIAQTDRVPGNSRLADKKTTVFYSHFYSPIGKIYIAVIDNLICNITIGKDSERRFIKYFSSFPFVRLSYSAKLTAGYSSVILKYLKKGNAPQFKSLCILKATDFEIAVWKAVLKIPYGETTTYQSIAKKLGSPSLSRAVGNALGKNPIPLIIPCHRIIKSNGDLGGFTGGKEIKERLLTLEKKTNQKL
ncbi:MAG: methylated-DNA--[protein]-cysteine S-methyltransferase [Candidatus Schekmanbacteria bacterium]|nr:MAG: methylated-DNA--[protein]-cysteine S-methyltransferase [Candidatus Schekmanbacteria bacterium]